MSGQRPPLKRAPGRIAACVLALATALMLAPTVAADPEADAAIGAAYDASGGPDGPLGPPDGGVYPIGEGFGQNFADGKIFFTPDTGAHFMQGAVLAKYEALGGPADGDLGFPTMDEGPGRVSPDSRNVTFSAADRPVIFWTAETGARVVRGAINAAWDDLGGSSGPLGVPAEDESYRGDVITQRFTGGELTWNRETREFTTVPPELAEQLGDVDVPEDPTSAINAARRAAGGALGPLGAKEGDEYPIEPDGVGQDFAGGKIFYTPATGANVLTGQVLEKYESVGGPQSDLGFPASSERDGGLGPNSRVATFTAEDNPVIFWTPDYGAVIVRGAMNAAWAELGGVTGELGAPTGDQSESGDEVTQRFSGGSITWNRADNRFTTEPAGLASQLSGLEVPGQDSPASPADQAAEPDTGTAGFSWHWWWLLIIIPLLLVLIGLIALSRWRRGRSADNGFDRYGDDHGSYDAVPVDASQRVGAEDDDAAVRFGEHYGDSAGAGYGLGALPPEEAESSSLWGFRDEGAEAPPEAEPSDASAEAEHQFAADESASADEFFDEDQDDVDTSPTLFVPNALNPDAETSGRHAAIDLDEPTPGQTAMHLPFEDDPHSAPDGYPIKASIRSGLYWAPESADYDEAAAEIWFASEEFARTNGFVKAD